MFFYFNLDRGFGGPNLRFETSNVLEHGIRLVGWGPPVEGITWDDWCRWELDNVHGLSEGWGCEILVVSQKKVKVRRFSFVYLYLDDLYLPIGARVLCLESHRFGEMSVVH